MRTITIKRSHILLAVTIWFAAFFALSITDFNNFQLLNIIGFLFLAILPGLLTLLIIRLKGLNFFAYVGLTVGFSLLELMVVGLLGNTFLPLLGVMRPLDKLPLLFDFYVLISILGTITWIRVKEVSIPIKRFVLFDNVRDLVLSAVPIFFVVLSILGAIRLNNGASNILTMIMLGSMAVYILVLIYYSERLDENTIPLALFFMALSLLLMTSLRGWYITGHDIQEEFRVFELAKNSGIWSIAAFRDPYNACMSITILPSIFASLLHVADQYVFKLFFQIFFALCPVLAYLICIRWSNRNTAFLSGLYFIAFPTFFSDMVFLVRQEMAFVFFGIMLYIIFEDKISVAARKVLFIVFGIGVILSHYSTTYTILFIFILTAITTPIFYKIMSKLRDNKLFKNSAFEIKPNESVASKKNITFGLIVILLVLSFIWTAVITNTSGNLEQVITDTFSSIGNGFTGDNRSIDATNLLSFGHVSQTDELLGYVKNIVDPTRSSEPDGSYYNYQPYMQYPLTALSDEIVPLTSFGSILETHGINIPDILPFLGAILSKLMEILGPIGIIYVFFNKSVVKKLDNEFYLIAFYSLVFVFLNIILPVLSTRYGIFRAMQQSMLVLGVFIVTGSILLGNLFTKILKWTSSIISKKHQFNYTNKITTSFAIIIFILFFLYSTTFIQQVFGGNIAVLQLDNAGRYYDNYLIKKTEVYGIDWLTRILPENTTVGQVQFEVETDRYTSNKFISVANLDPYNDIFPGLVRKNSYVFIGEGTVRTDRATFLYNGDQISYKYPLQFLDDNKDLIYSNGGSDIYR